MKRRPRCTASFSISSSSSGERLGVAAGLLAHAGPVDQVGLLEGRERVQLEALAREVLEQDLAAREGDPVARGRVGQLAPVLAVARQLEEHHRHPRGVQPAAEGEPLHRVDHVAELRAARAAEAPQGAARGRGTGGSSAGSAERLIFLARSVLTSARRTARRPRAVEVAAAPAVTPRAARRAAAGGGRSLAERAGTTGSERRTAWSPSTTITSAACAGARSAPPRSGLPARSCGVRSASFLQRRQLPGVAVARGGRSPTLRRVRLRLLALVFVAVALVSCGGESDQGDVEEPARPGVPPVDQERRPEGGRAAAAEGQRVARPARCASRRAARSGPTRASCPPRTSS